VGTGHALAADKGRVGERYILSGNIVTLDEWGRLLYKLSGATMPPAIPTFFAGMYAAFGEIISRFTKHPPVLSYETFRTVSHCFQVNGSKALKELGVEYTSLEDGLRKTILWYWEQGWLRHQLAPGTTGAGMEHSKSGLGKDGDDFSDPKITFEDDGAIRENLAKLQKMQSRNKGSRL
jgi:dihydroflavonol-4-reductase